MLYRRAAWDTADFKIIQNVRKQNSHTQRILEQLNEILIMENISLDEFSNKAKQLINELLPRWRNPFNVHHGGNYINITYNYKDLIRVIRK